MCFTFIGCNSQKKQRLVNLGTTCEKHSDKYWACHKVKVLLPQWLRITFRYTLAMENRVMWYHKKARATNLMPAAVHDFVHSMRCQMWSIKSVSLRNLTDNFTIWFTFKRHFALCEDFPHQHTWMWTKIFRTKQDPQTHKLFNNVRSPKITLSFPCID